ncbi:DNA-formamidopyrimidine glycosylase [Candidatus Nomurabacteria bacterium RIFCSPLOWO2_02_FULL_44_12]|uniref:DNA-formamidopyrimidine glycosylase n=1 Tax=Candidatus Nomurabacteria bacterium RIFCSPLOWO2_12_FULL_44_11 TaxID=1801796 RepID=A0A1F6Y6P8_9BACT|nr:MAG: DNA-formamidopyrimidine glycosylase [Candidatus Nomurabacteria bacterium RIFCSPLOWO2_12_FULL_44_11]OGJ08726.1 MAG: DNA-formamidopyrimidine glycosylase [Candidatus Nomurabacteria bacterium RIFCSPLOWO2_02_FULL_44_12]
MPELPEVETTVRGLRKTIQGLVIKDVWTDLATKDKRKDGTVADVKHFKTFRRGVSGKKVISVERRAKNILINLSHGQTILIHLKMTGHLLYGDYKKDPINRFIHFVITFNNGEKLYFSDMRKFGKIVLLDTKTAHDTKHLNNVGPEPLEKDFTIGVLRKRLGTKPKGKIKTVLMDQSVIAGIGNIYSDEILWRAGVHPERKTSKIKESELKLIFKAIKETLKKGIDFGGDSMSDYRNIYGLPGKFQLHHQTYRRTGQKCRKCGGVIKRKVINGRSAHFCSKHQK